MIIFLFFFSSRRRHTRSYGDWSSDVCSSDLRFYERAEVKDVIAYLQAIDNPYDAVSLTRVANKPRRGVGDTSLSRLQTLADGEGISLWEALGRADEAGLATASLRAVQSFYGLLQSLMSGAM